MILGHLILFTACLVIIFTNRKIAILAFIVGVTFIPQEAAFSLGSLNMPPLRILSIIGMIRVLARREFPAHVPADTVAFLFVPICLLSSFFHDPVGGAFIFRGGTVIDAIFPYFILRAWIKTYEDFLWYLYTCIVSVFPLLLCMLFEKISGTNPFGYLSGSFDVNMRMGELRARGPFRHPILTGIVSAIYVPMALAFWHRKPQLTKAAIVTAVIVTILTVSSGPILILGAVVFALVLWRYRQYTKTIIWGSFCVLLVLHLVMKAPVWYLAARIDFTGGSSSWHRAQLIDTSLKHLSEWWIAGTDYTRHWMPTGVSWSLDHTDITNHYFKMGVLGGLPLMFTLIFLLRRGFKAISLALANLSGSDMEKQFVLWCAGSALFGHTLAMLSVGYFDQTVGLFYALLGGIVSCSTILQSADLPES